MQMCVFIYLAKLEADKTQLQRMCYLESLVDDHQLLELMSQVHLLQTYVEQSCNCDAIMKISDFHVVDFITTESRACESVPKAHLYQVLISYLSNLH